MTIAQEILAGLRCQYCEARTELVDDAQVYGRSYGGQLYLCKPCWAYVGTHKDTNPPQSLGTVANADLRLLRKTAHELFDSLWQRSRKNRSRSAAYAWLALELDMIPGLVHMGMFDEQTCERVIEICRPIYERRQEEIRQSHANQTNPVEPCPPPPTT